ncbi:hypothetical protein BJY52DRAFT_1213395 [Lactarius psammicola]|nr:hypothetical protein BJY52DRAFT_1213395 [Lactarius psammicola]
MGATQFEPTLPRFLQLSQSPLPTQASKPVPVHATYSHERPFGQAQVLWWPCSSHDGSVTPRTVLLFIPGNPGLLDFYVPFLDAIYAEANSSTSSTSVTIFAHAHLGLSSYIGGDRSFPDTSSVTLPAQIQAHVEFLDELLTAYDLEASVLLVGHSIGAWFIQEMLKARAAALRARKRVGAFMLTPTLSEIGRSPSGKILSPFFCPPGPRALAYLSLLVQHAPQWVIRLVLHSWPESQRHVLRRFLQAPAAIYASLTMADDEVRSVLDPDVGSLREFSDILWFYYAERDDWVGGQREVILRALRGTSAEVRAVHGRSDIPHGFCLNHSAEVASQCTEWMKAGGFLGDVGSTG